MRTIALATFGAFALAATAQAAPSASASAASCGPPDGPLLGIGRIDGTRTLAPLEPRTLRPRAALRVPLPLRRVIGSDFAFSPNCDAVALPVLRGRILLVDLERGRRTGILTLGGRSAVGRLAWPRADRLTGFTGPYRHQRVVTVSMPDGRVVASHRIGGRPWVVETTSLGTLALTGRPGRIAPVTLVLHPDGGLLRVLLPRIEAGFDDTGPRAQAVTPGLAVNETLGRAYVVAASEPVVAEVDLADGTVSYHALRGGAGTAGPVATAADRVGLGPYRVARWVGDGTIAVAGGTIRPKSRWRRLGARGLRATRIAPDGLRIIRTADWSMTMLDPRLPWFTQAGDALLGMGPESEATGLVAYGTDGRRRFTRHRGTRHARLSGAAWPYAYVTTRRPPRTYVVDLRSGRTVNEIPSRRPPQLLVR